MNTFPSGNATKSVSIFSIIGKTVSVAISICIRVPGSMNVCTHCTCSSGQLSMEKYITFWEMFLPEMLNIN